MTAKTSKTIESLGLGKGARIECLTLKEIYNRFIAGKIDTSASFQRSAKPQWDKPEYVSDVFDSIRRGFSLGLITVNETDSGSWLVTDGNHRVRFVSGVYKGIFQFEGESILDLPDSSWFDDFKFPFEVFSGLDDEELGTLFERRNGGVALTPYEQRKSQILKLVTDSNFTSLVARLLAILPPVAGKSARRETAEEILLQAISAKLGNRDFTGKAFIAYIKSHLSESLTTLSSIGDSLTGLEECTAGDTEKTYKKALKKSWLNVLLASQKFPSAVNLAEFLSHKGTDQTEFKNAAGSASASVASVTARLAIVEKIVKNTFTRDSEITKPATKKDDKPEKTLETAITGNSSNEIKAVRAGINEKVSKLINDTWGDKLNDTNIKKVLKYADLVGSEFTPRIDNGKLTFSVISDSSRFPVIFKVEDVLKD
jgi:hypothetical protein